MEIGEKIKHRRELLGMSQDELAKKVGYKSRSSINKIETDGRGLPQSKIVAFAKALETTPAYLMGWEQSKEYNTIQTEEEYQAALEMIDFLKNLKIETEFDMKLINCYKILNKDGKEKAVSYIQDLSKIPEYQDTEKIKIANESTNDNFNSGTSETEYILTLKNYKDFLKNKQSKYWDKLKNELEIVSKPNDDN